jgi:hypothetical protein
MNYLLTLCDTLSGSKQKTTKVELALKRAQIYSECGMHEESLDDYHYVVENREYLAQRDPAFLSQLSQLKMREYEFTRQRNPSNQPQVVENSHSEQSQK